MQYRADIDGLRAVAIVPVLLYHAEVAGVGGGFVGVDVFFVISGFLITSLILAEIREESFSILQFYARRARRILPALFVVIAATLAVGSVLLLSTDFSDLVRSALSSVLFVSNVYLWSSSSYFASAAEMKPLLHTWSLAVEEQYYIFFPALLLFVIRRGRSVAGVLLVILAASFGLSVWAVPRAPEAAFFLAPTRVWELLVGSLLALGVVPPLAGRAGREVVGAAGLALIVASVLAFDEQTPFPGVNALWPCLGAAMVIHAEGSAVGRLLSTRPLVFVGLVSYSLYLWHWPLIVFARYEGWFTGAPLETAAVLAASFGLAVASWRLVELPVRRSRLLADRDRMLRGAGGAIVGAAALLLALDLVHAPGAVGPAGRELGRAEARAAYGEGTCFFSSGAPLASIVPERCLTPDPTRPTYLLIGDSFAAHLWPGLRQALPGKDVLQLTFGGCPPFLVGPSREDPGCRKVIAAVAAAVESTRFDAILVAANWQSGERAALAATLSYLRPLTDRVVLFGPIVRYRANLPELITASANPEREVVKYRIVPDDEDRRLRAMAADLGVGYVSLLELICPKGNCLLYDTDGKPIQWDNGHLTPEGSIELMSDAAAQGELPAM